MDFDLTTFLLEIANFLILIWILQRFLYRPVQEAIQRRKQAIAGTLAQAQDARSEGERLKNQYEHRLEQWEREKDDARGELAKEIESERARRMDALRRELEQEQQRSRLLEERRVTELRRHIEEEAGARAAQFAARLFERLVAPDLEARIVELFLEDLRGLSEGEREPIKSASRAQGARILVTTAYPLRQDQRSTLTTTLRGVIDDTLQLEYSEDPGLLAGIRVGIGPWVLRANLRDELHFFSETSRDQAD